MSAPARAELPIAFGFKLIGYFIGLALLNPLAFVLAPIPVATHALRGQRFEARMFVLVAVLSGVMVSIFGFRYQVIPNILYSNLGWLIAWAIQRQVSYTRVFMPLVIVVIGVQVFMGVANWESGTLARERLIGHLQERLDSPEASGFSENYERQLNNQIQLLERWGTILVGSSAAAALFGVSIMLSFVWRIVERTSDVRPAGRFTDMRPHDAVVWLAIAAVGLWFWHTQSPQLWAEAIALNLAIGLFALYTLNGLGVLTYGFEVLKPHPIVLLLAFLVLVFFGGLLFMAMLGLFDTWGEFRKRIDARAQALRDGPDDEA